MVECEICLEEYQEGDLVLHRQTCVVRLMFRCSRCNDDFVNKEGLWNHLDLHEIADESKELNYQEIKAKFKFYQCTLCNDQRAYSENSYREHVKDVHDGFFLRCSGRGESFRSEQLKNDHDVSHCNAGDETVFSNYKVLQEELVLEDENFISNAEDFNTANDVDNNTMDEESTKSEDLSLQYVCDTCGQAFSSKAYFLRHKNAKNSCSKKKLQKCLHCQKILLLKDYQAHLRLCEKMTHTCELCLMKFPSSRHRKIHLKQVHLSEGVFNNAKLDNTQVEDVMDKTTVSRSNSPPLTGVIGDSDISLTKKSIADNTTSSSSSTKCVHCGKECTTRKHLLQHNYKLHQPILCTICGITFEGSSQLRYHKKQAHSETDKGPRYECDKCLEKFRCLTLYKRHSNVCDRVLNDALTNQCSGEPILKEKSDSNEMTEENTPNEESRTKCSHCGIEESSAASLARHILIYHDPVACDFCGITLDSFSQAQHHLEWMHKESKIKCPHCSKSFCQKLRLRSHVSHCEKEIVPCELCGTMFKSEKSIKDHQNNGNCAYKNRMNQRQKTGEMSLVDDEADSGLSQTKCYYCYEEFSCPGYLIHHLKISHKLTKCDTCGMTVIGLSGTKNHRIVSHKEPKYKCSTCAKKFHQKRKYETHFLECEHRMYRCKLCGLTFKKIEAVEIHNQQHHPDEKSSEIFQIIQDRRQAQNNDLEMEGAVEETATSARDDQVQSTNEASDFQTSGHSLAKQSTMVSVASSNDSSEIKVNPKDALQPIVGNLSNQLFPCTDCDLSFYSYRKLCYHKRTRHQERKFQCTHCPRKFHFKEVLESHLSVCANRVANPKYTCELCGRQFSSVKYHFRRFHSDEIKKQVEKTVGNSSNQPYWCKICGMTFTTRSQNYYHELTRHIEGKHQCPICPQKFSMKKRADDHASRCALFKHACNLCGRRFISPGRVLSHKSQVHHVNLPLSQASIEGTERQGNKEQTSCTICRIPFAGADELMKHKLTCTKREKEIDDSHFGAEQASLHHHAKEAQQGENIDLNLEIKVEDTVLLEREYPIFNSDQGDGPP